jgi:hypothetical protein
MTHARFALALILAALIAGPMQATILSFDITSLPDEPYEMAIAEIKKAEAAATSLSLAWDELETPEGTYGPEFDWPTIANDFYSSANISLTLTFLVIDTN